MVRKSRVENRDSLGPPTSIKTLLRGKRMLVIVPLTFRAACAFVAQHHRHNKPPHGMKFCIGLEEDGVLVGVGIAGRPVARHLDDGRTLEVNRTCTDGTRNANSMLYGAIWRAAKAMGYRRCVTYTQAEETGSSLRAAGWVISEKLAPRPNWNKSSGSSKIKRDPNGPGDVARIRWEIHS